MICVSHSWVQLNYLLHDWKQKKKGKGEKLGVGRWLNKMGTTTLGGGEWRLRFGSHWVDVQSWRISINCMKFRHALTSMRSLANTIKFYVMSQIRIILQMLIRAKKSCETTHSARSSLISCHLKFRSSDKNASIKSPLMKTETYCTGRPFHL